jgi:DNA-binding response OmpR family regulator
MTQRDKLLVLSHDPNLTDVRMIALEKVGYEVLTTSDSQTIKRTCAEHSLRLVIVGHSLLPAEKRRVWLEVREHCKIPLLELHKENGPELMPPAFFHDPRSR